MKNIFIILLILACSSAYAFDIDHCNILQDEPYQQYPCDIEGQYNSEGIFKCFCNTDIQVCNIDNLCKNRLVDEYFMNNHEGMCYNYTCNEDCQPLKLEYISGCEDDSDCDGIIETLDLCNSTQGGAITDTHGCSCSQKTSTHCTDIVNNMGSSSATEICCEYGCSTEVIGASNLYLGAKCVEDNIEEKQPTNIKEDSIKEGNLYCWGQNKNGRLGIGIDDDEFYKAPILIDQIGKVKHVEIGYEFSCANDMNNNLFCWGKVARTGSHMFESAPLIIKKDVIQFDKGGSNICSIDSNNNLYCFWGFRYDGIFTGENYLQKYFDSSFHMLLRFNESNIKSFSLGDNHICTINIRNELDCWGSNSQGQLGIGYKSYRNLTKNKIMDNVRSVSVGLYHTCAIDMENNLFCWGYNIYGQVGFTYEKYVLEPTKIMENIRSVSLGRDHTCAIDIEDNLICWGSNYKEQIGIEEERTNEPTKIMENVLSIDTDKYYTTSIDSDHRFYLWDDDTRFNLFDERKLLYYMNFTSLDIYTNMVCGITPDNENIPYEVCVRDSECKKNELCISGLCEEVTRCYDYDGPDNFDNRSYVDIEYGNSVKKFEDYCYNSWITFDYYCQGKQIKKSNKSCECFMGKCVSTDECKYDSDCKDEICNNGKCEANEIPIECTTNSDCSSGQICVSNSCEQVKAINCIDYDGLGNYDNSSYLELTYSDGRIESFEDYCYNETLAIDYYCHMNRSMKSNQSCNCESGLCKDDIISIIPSDQEIISCNDHDGKSNFEISSYVELRYAEKSSNWFKKFFSRIFNTGDAEEFEDECKIYDGKEYALDYSCNKNELSVSKKECECVEGMCLTVFKCEDKGDHISLKYNDKSTENFEDYTFRTKTVDYQCDNRDYYSVYDDEPILEEDYTWQNYYKEAVDIAVESEDIFIYAETQTCNVADAIANIYRDGILIRNTSLNFMSNDNTIARKLIKLEYNEGYFNEFTFEIVCNGVSLGKSNILKLFPDDSDNLYAKCFNQKQCSYDYEDDICFKTDKRCNWMHNNATLKTLDQWDVIFARYMQGHGDLEENEFRFGPKIGDNYLSSEMSELDLKHYLTSKGFPIAQFESKFGRAAPLKGMDFIFTYVEEDAPVIMDEDECSCIPEDKCTVGETKCSQGNKMICEEFGNGDFWIVEKNCGSRYIDGAYFPYCEEKDGEAYCARTNDEGYPFCVELDDYKYIMKDGKPTQIENGDCYEYYEGSRVGDYSRERTYDGCSWSNWEWTDYDCRCNEENYEEYQTAFGTICRSKEVPACDDPDQYQALSTAFEVICKDKPQCGCDDDQVCVELHPIPEGCGPEEAVVTDTGMNGVVCVERPYEIEDSSCFNKYDCDAGEDCMTFWSTNTPYNVMTGICSKEDRRCIDGCYNNKDCPSGYKCMLYDQWEEKFLINNMGKCENELEVIKMGIDKPIDRIFYEGKNNIVEMCYTVYDNTINLYYGKGICRGQWKMDPLMWSYNPKNNCSTGWERIETVTDQQEIENRKLCNMENFEPTAIKIGIEDNDKVKSYYSGFNNEVEFCGIRNGKPMHGKGICYGNWTLNPLDWTSTCDGDGDSTKEDWYYNSDDYYEDISCADNVGLE